MKEIKDNKREDMWVPKTSGSDDELLLGLEGYPTWFLCGGVRINKFRANSHEFCGIILCWQATVAANLCNSHEALSQQGLYTHQAFDPPHQEPCRGDCVLLLASGSLTSSLKRPMTTSNCKNSLWRVTRRVWEKWISIVEVVGEPHEGSRMSWVSPQDGEPAWLTIRVLRMW